MDFLSELNPEQREAVEQIEGPLLILAGAGSGKTRVIAFRIAYLVGGGFAREEEVLAVTFTNKAAEEMRSRVSTILGADPRKMWISTFHSMCARLLRREATQIGLERDFVIYDSSDQVAAIKQALRDVDVDEKLLAPRVALSRISQAKNRMETPDDLKQKSWNFREEQIGKVYARYLEILKESGALDFDDLLLKSVLLFEQSPQTRERYANRFRFVMIDESTRTPIVRSTCWSATSRRCIGISPWSAIRISRSTSGAAPISTTSSTSSATSPTRRWCGSSATIARRR